MRAKSSKNKDSGRFEKVGWFVHIVQKSSGKFVDLTCGISLKLLDKVYFIW
jgi:hypothetical protein